MAGVYDVGHVFADLEGVFDDVVHFLFVFASFFVHFVEVEGGCFFYEVGGGWCVDARSYAEGLDFFWEDGDDLNFVYGHGDSFLLFFGGWGLTLSWWWLRLDGLIFVWLVMFLFSEWLAVGGV